MNNFLFLTTANLAANPRLTKELNLALTSGHSATVIFFKLGNWSDLKSWELARDLKLTFSSKVEFIAMDATSKNRISWFFWGLMEKGARTLNPIFKNNVFINAVAHSRRSLQLLKKSLTLNLQPDIIVGHTLGALFPAYYLGKKFGVPFVFDVEDYHPREAIPNNNYNEIERREFLMKLLLPNSEAFTAASPLIEKYTLELIGTHKNHFVVLNCFPKDEFLSPAIENYVENMDLKFIWFSQKIGFGRGLEQFFEVIKKISFSKFEFIRITLVGECDPNFRELIIDPIVDAEDDIKIDIKIIPPISQSKIHKELSLHDVGLALEWNSVDFNRQICLTNKIIAYAQAGLYIFATNTAAQSQFIKEHPEMGICFGQTQSEMLDAITKTIMQSRVLKKERMKRYNLAKSISWEKESQKIQQLWMSI